MICPKCRGRGSFMAIADNMRHKGIPWNKISCVLCNETGHISKEQAWWIREATVLSELRMSLGLCVSEAASNLGVDVLKWNDAEHGRTDPRPMLLSLSRTGATY